MSKEAKAQARVGVGVEVMWRTLAQHLSSSVPKAVPNLVREVEIVEGDGGLGTILLFHFAPGVPNVIYQKEKIVELDETQRLIGLAVIEGGRLNFGFTSYVTFFRLTGSGEKETLIDITVVYDTETKEEDEEHLMAKTTGSTMLFIKHLENYLLKLNT